jgi:sulfite reductase alpha subunit-like flavoprotein
MRTILPGVADVFCWYHFFADNTCREVYVLYGSQTGNAESLAVELAGRLSEQGISSKCESLNTVKKLPLKDLASLLIIICSTTGNGDAPENADGWWRTIKLRSAVRAECLCNGDVANSVPY